MARRKRSPQQLPVELHLQSIEHAYISLQRTQRTLAAMLIAAAVAGFVFFPAHEPLGKRIFLPVIFATTLMTFAYTVRNSMVQPALAELRRQPGNRALLARWRRNNLIVFCMLTAVGVIGFGMQLFGAAAPISVTLYACAVGYLFLLRPTRP
jgi:hypothetical protein